MAITKAPFGGTYAVTEIVSAAAQTEILAQIDLLIALIPDVDNLEGAAGNPDFDEISPRVASALRVELEALKTAIDAAPTS